MLVRVPLRYPILLVIILFFTNSNCQKLISTSGYDYLANDFSISWSIGEVVNSTYRLTDSLYLTQGYQQPLLLCSPCETKDSSTLVVYFDDFNSEENKINHNTLKEISDQIGSINIAPNPTIERLNFNTSILFNGKGSISIIDAEGKVMRLETINYITSEPTIQSIDIQHFLPGKYYLRISNGTTVISRPFIKL